MHSWHDKLIHKNKAKQSLTLSKPNLGNRHQANFRQHAPRKALSKLRSVGQSQACKWPRHAPECKAGNALCSGGGPGQSFTPPSTAGKPSGANHPDGLVKSLPLPENLGSHLRHFRVCLSVQSQKLGHSPKPSSPQMHFSLKQPGSRSNMFQLTCPRKLQRT